MIAANPLREEVLSRKKEEKVVEADDESGRVDQVETLLESMFEGGRSVIVRPPPQPPSQAHLPLTHDRVVAILEDKVSLTPVNLTAPTLPPSPQQPIPMQISEVIYIFCANLTLIVDIRYGTKNVPLCAFMRYLETS